MRITTLSTLVALAWGTASGCLSSGTSAAVDTATLDDTTDGASHEDTATPAPAAVDLLVVLDNSGSMCGEQRALTEALAAAAARLVDRTGVDLRVAVTTQDVACDPNGVSIVASKGVFNTRTFDSYPPACQEARVRECVDDAACANMDCVVRGECAEDDPTCTCGAEPGAWRCRTSSSEACLENPNGTINSRCARRCHTDQECRDVFGDPTYVCQRPTANDADWGCLRPPPTAGCPEVLPPVLDGANLDLIPCLASVRTNQEKCYKYQQGMNASLLALDPIGPNAAQADAFLRDDAWLVVLYVTDDDDCSVTPGALIAEEHYDTCDFLPTVDDGGPLLSVATVTARLKALKRDPGRVIVAAVAGDSMETDPGAVAAERQAYRDSKGAGRICYHQTYVCHSDAGPAAFASRYLELTAAFGPNGVFVNICDDPSAAYDAVADHIIQAVNR